MPHNTIPPIEQLDRMDDLSGSALYNAEVKRLPLLTREEQQPYISAARTGDTDSQNALVLNCLNWTMYRAWAVYRDQTPQHSDVMDLIGHANVSMLEALPSALRADDPTAYLMTVSASAMRRYVAYKDPMIERPKDKPLRDEPHFTTVSIESSTTLPHSLAGPDMQLVKDDEREQIDSEEYQIVYDAVQSLSIRHRLVLTLSYGMFGSPAMKNEDIARMLNLPKTTVEKYLWRAKKNLAKRLGGYAMKKTQESVA